MIFVIQQLRDLPLIQARLRLYERVRKLQEKHLKRYRRSRKILEILNKKQQQDELELLGLIEGVENLKEASVLEETLILTTLIHKVSRRQRTLLAVGEEMKLGQGKRKNKPHQSELIRDTIRNLYEAK